MFKVETDGAHIEMENASLGELVEKVLSGQAAEFVKVFDLHISDVILVAKRSGFAPQIIAELHRNPRGCKGKTHVKIQNGPLQCYDNIAEIRIVERQYPQGD